MTYAAIERTIVDWFEANSVPVEHRDGEWFAMSEDGDFTLSLSALAIAVHQTANAEITSNARKE
jgi:hypothetical protein